jgi:hypothetical protein
MSKNIIDSTNWTVTEHTTLWDEKIILITLKGKCKLDEQVIAMSEEQYQELLTFNNIRSE